MRTYERSGITVDQCGECRGIFLDRGELERLVDAELKYNAPAAPPQQRYEEKRHDDRRYDNDRRDNDRRYDDRRYDDRKHDDRRYDDDRRYGDQYRGKKKQKSFLEQLFD
jgi:Zn-finger nucleic acid-binding protein